MTKRSRWSLPKDPVLTTWGLIAVAVLIAAGILVLLRPV
jgi:hypothetical protein